MSSAGFGARGGPYRSGAIADAWRRIDPLRLAGPPLLFGLRLWASVCFSLYIAFWLELDNPSWAGVSAAIVCQPHLGASLRKAPFLLAGTLVGAVAIVVLTACFPQSRIGFLLGLALWAAACGLLATVLRNFAAYGAALAGYTPAIIAISELGATGVASGQAFMLAVTRASEISIGIVCAGLVIAGTDLGSARRRLSDLLAEIVAAIIRRFTETVSLAGPDQFEMQAVRRELVRRVIALDPIIDEAIGESVGLRYHAPMLQAARDGLFAALAGWRIVDVRLMHLADQEVRREADAVREYLPPEIGLAAPGDPSNLIVGTTQLRRSCAAAMRALISLPATTPSLRLLADQTTEVLRGIVHALNGLLLLAADSDRPVPLKHSAPLRVPDWLPAVINALRVFATISAVAVFWIVTEWPNGVSAIAFAAIVVSLFSPRADQAYAAALSFLLGVSLIAVLAAMVKFIVLPGVETFVGFSIAIGLVLVPVGALAAQPWQTGMFTAMAVIFGALLAPANQMSYDTEQFYNSALAIIAGVGAAALSFRLLPPLSPALRARRLLALTLRDLRRLAAGRIPLTPDDWQSQVYGRLRALPEAATPLQRAQLLAALSVGTETIRLRRIASRFGLVSELEPALDAMARGNSAIATTRLERLDRAFTSLLSAGSEASATLRARGGILAILEALAQHAPYFNEGAPE